MRNAIRLIVLLGVLWLFLFLVASCAEAQVYTVTDIGPNIYPAGINAKGQVSGSGLCSTCGPNQQALLWSASTGLKDLGGSINNFLGGSAALGLNDLGEVVGTSNSPFSPIPCCDAFLWSSSGKIQDLGAPPGCAAIGVGINDRGEVIGESDPNTLPSNVTCHLFLWNSTSGMQDIGFPAGAFVAGVSGINNAGTAAGGYIRGADFTPRSYIWTSLGGFRDLGIPQSEAAGINNKGHVVGRYNVACVFCDSGHAFLWDRQHGVRDLGTLPGQAFSYSWALNVHDQVVGFSGPYAFLWTKTTGMLNLNDLIDSSSGWQLYFAAGINAKGQIVGRGLLNGEEHGFLLTLKQE